MRAHEDSWRLFIAIELPSAVRRTIGAHIDRLRLALPKARASWTREENLHLTLKFLGATSVSKIESLATALRRAADELTSFELAFSGCGAFPVRGQPRVLWIGIEDPTETLVKFHLALEDECARANFPREERPLRPHLTIARLRQPRGARDLVHLHEEFGFDPVTVRVSASCLIRSELSSGGSRYTVISRSEFPAGPSDNTEPPAVPNG